MGTAVDQKDLMSTTVRFQFPPLQTVVVRWGCRLSVVRSLSSLSLFNGKSEIQIFMWTLLIFKSWQPFQIFLEVCGPNKTHL